ncbi:MAG: metallophosphoesterase [Candidatus Hadarchaeales archaeon]
MGLRIAATGDVHSPKYLDLFGEALGRMGKVDLFLLAGDLVYKNDHTQLAPLLETLRKFHEGEVLACFGNEEYLQDREKYRKLKAPRWVEDEAVIVEVRGTEVGVVGSQGSLSRPTYWQRTHLPGIAEIYEERVKLLDRLLKELNTEVKVVLTHYAPTFATVKGEDRESLPEIGNRKLEEVIARRQPDLWVHAHAHRASVLETTMGRTLVVNASLPARREIYVTDLPRKSGLDTFLPQEVR